MAAMELDTAQIPLDDEYSPRKRFKVSELPLNSSQRSTIDSLLHTIKKKGEYDALRKCVWAQYLESVRAISLPCLAKPMALTLIVSFDPDAAYRKTKLPSRIL